MNNMLRADMLDDRKVTLLKHIEGAPGIRYRELLRLTQLSNGVLFHHLTLLEEAGLIQVERTPSTKTTRYYPANFSKSESAILAIVRHEPLRQIILCLLEHDVCTVNDIVSLTHKAPSTVSVHLKHLKETGLVAVRRKEMCLSYCLVDRESVADVISKYRTSLVDKAVDNFVGMVEEL